VLKRRPFSARGGLTSTTTARAGAPSLALWCACVDTASSRTVSSRTRCLVRQRRPHPSLVPLSSSQAALRGLTWRLLGVGTRPGCLHPPRRGLGPATLEARRSSTDRSFLVPVLLFPRAAGLLLCFLCTIVTRPLRIDHPFRWLFHSVLEGSSRGSCSGTFYPVSGSPPPVSTMPPSKRQRFLERGDLAAKKAEEQQVIAGYSQQPLDDCPDIAPLTAERREGYMREWKE
jgi:hypothetical protein